jgi:hypothetical protein
VHICPCCGRLMYINQTAKISLNELHQSDEFITSIVNPLISSTTVNDQRFCRTCKTNILKGKVPRLALSNGLDFPTIPPEIQVRNNQFIFLKTKIAVLQSWFIFLLQSYFYEFFFRVYLPLRSV